MIVASRALELHPDRFAVLEDRDGPTYAAAMLLDNGADLVTAGREFSVAGVPDREPTGRVDEEVSVSGAAGGGRGHVRTSAARSRSTLSRNRTAGSAVSIAAVPIPQQTALPSRQTLIDRKEGLDVRLG